MACAASDLAKLKTAESCIVCLPGQQNEFCRVMEGASDKGQCSTACSTKYGTSNNCYKDGNCFCFDTQPTCTDLETDAGNCSTSDGKPCYTGVVTGKSDAEKQVSCGSKCDGWGSKDNVKVCSNGKCYCLKPTAARPIVVCSGNGSNCPSSTAECKNQPQYTCPAVPSQNLPESCLMRPGSPNADNAYLHAPSLTKGSQALNPADLLQMRCDCDREIKPAFKSSPWKDRPLDLIWKEAIKAAQAGGTNVLQEFQSAVGGNSVPNLQAAELLCRYSNLTDPRSKKPSASISQDPVGWFRESAKGKGMYVILLMFIYYIYFNLFVQSFFPVVYNYPSAIGSILWFRTNILIPNMNMKRNISFFGLLFCIFIASIVIIYESESNKTTFISDFISSAFPKSLNLGSKDFWRGGFAFWTKDFWVNNQIGWLFWVMAFLAVCGLIIRSVALRFVSDGIGIIVSLFFHFLAWFVITVNLFMAYLVPGVALFFLILYRSGLGLWGAVVPNGWGANNLAGTIIGIIQAFLGLVPSDKWVIPFLPWIGVLSKVLNLAAGTNPMPAYFDRNNLGVPTGTTDANLFGS